MKTTGLKSLQLDELQQARAGLSKLTTILNEFHVMNPGMEVQTILVFLLVSKYHPEPCPMNEVQTTLGLARAATSRNVANLTDVHWRGGPGLNLISSEIDHHDSRRRNLRLTKKGQSKYDLFTKVLNNT